MLQNVIDKKHCNIGLFKRKNALFLKFDGEEECCRNRARKQKISQFMNRRKASIFATLLCAKYGLKVTKKHEKN